MCPMAYNQHVASYNHSGRRHGNIGQGMEGVKTLPPIQHPRRSCSRGSNDGERDQRSSNKYDTIKKLIKTGRKVNECKNPGDTPAIHGSDKPGESSLSTSWGTIRPLSAERAISKEHEHKLVESNLRPKTSSNGKVISKLLEGTKRKSYPPTTTMEWFNQQASLTKNSARLRRELSKSCPMLTNNLSKLAVDIDEKTSIRSQLPIDQQNIQTTNSPALISKEETNVKSKLSGEKERVKHKSKKLLAFSKSLDDNSSSYKPFRPPPNQMVPTQPEAHGLSEKGTNRDRQVQMGKGDGLKKITSGRHDDGMTYRPPKPPSWQTIQTETEKILDAQPNGISSEKYNVPISNDLPSNSGTIPKADRQCQSAGSSRSPRSPIKNLPDDYGDDVAGKSLEIQTSTNRPRGGQRRSNIKRTRSRVIDAREIPDHAPIIPLSKTMHSEFQLRKTQYDNDVYLSDNKARCQQWLAGLLYIEVDGDDNEAIMGSSSSPSRVPRAAASVEIDVDDENEFVTCDLELSRDKWMYVGSPYPSSGSEEGT